MGRGPRPRRRPAPRRPCPPRTDCIAGDDTVRTRRYPCHQLQQSNRLSYGAYSRTAGLVHREEKKLDLGPERTIPKTATSLALNHYARPRCYLYARPRCYRAQLRCRRSQIRRALYPSLSVIRVELCIRVYRVQLRCRRSQVLLQFQRKELCIRVYLYCDASGRQNHHQPWTFNAKRRTCLQAPPSKPSLLGPSCIAACNGHTPPRPSAQKSRVLFKRLSVK